MSKEKKDPVNSVNDLKDKEKKKLPMWGVPKYAEPPSWSHKSLWD
jgi:hypothetical protein